MKRILFWAVLIIAIAIPAAEAQTGFCKSCAQMDNNQRTAEIRKMYSETANNKNLTTKKYEYMLEEQGQGGVIPYLVNQLLKSAFFLQISEIKFGY